MPPDDTVVITTAPRWDSATLSRVERALAHYVGPMAKRMVAEAARQSPDAESLYHSLARSLQTTADRSAFLRALGEGARLEPTLGGAAASGRTPAPPTQRGHIAIPAEAVAAAQAALAQVMGPIARVLARQAAEQAASPEDFIERLCASVARADQAALLRRRLRAEVEPKLR